MIIQGEKLDFCDMLMVPQSANSPDIDLSSRSKVDLNRTFSFLHSKRKWTGIPVIASNLDTLGVFDVADEMARYEMLTCLHKYYSIKHIMEYLSGYYPRKNACFTTFGIGKDDKEKLKQFRQLHYDLPMICLDIANGYISQFINSIKEARELYPNSILMAGNVCTPEGVGKLLKAGADIVKVGIGSGSFCITRKVTGVGYPQFSCVVECSEAAHNMGGHICSDGGCVDVADIAKAIGGGADFVMLGGMLSGYRECAGQWITDENNEPVAVVSYGMSSREAMDKYSGGMAEYKASEGKRVEVPYRGPIANCLQTIKGGLSSACTLSGTNRLDCLNEQAIFVKVHRTHNTVFGI